MEAFALDGLAETSLEGLLTRDIFAFGAAELYIRVREKVEIVAELEGAEEDEWAPLRSDVANDVVDAIERS